MSTSASTAVRRAALRVLYAVDVSGLTERELLRNLRHTFEEEDPALQDRWEEVEGWVKGVRSSQESIDKEITRLSPRWRIDRMASVDRNLLRLGLFELDHPTVPAIVTINACIELGKEFGSSSTPGFINGLLDQHCKDQKISLKS